MEEISADAGTRSVGPDFSGACFGGADLIRDDVLLAGLGADVGGFGPSPFGADRKLDRSEMSRDFLASVVDSDILGLGTGLCGFSPAERWSLPG